MFAKLSELLLNFCTQLYVQIFQDTNRTFKFPVIDAIIISRQSHGIPAPSLLIYYYSLLFLVLFCASMKLNVNTKKEEMDRMNISWDWS